MLKEVVGNHVKKTHFDTDLGACLLPVSPLLVPVREPTLEGR